MRRRGSRRASFPFCSCPCSDEGECVCRRIASMQGESDQPVVAPSTTPTVTRIAVPPMRPGARARKPPRFLNDRSGIGCRTLDHLCTSAKGPSQNSKRFELLKGVELPQSNTEPFGTKRYRTSNRKIVQKSRNRPISVFALCEPVGARDDRRTGTPASSDFCNLTDRLPWLAP